MSQRRVQEKISREEICAVYAQGEAAVIALVESLLERIEQVEGRIEVLENQRLCRKKDLWTNDLSRSHCTKQPLQRLQQ